MVANKTKAHKIQPSSKKIHKHITKRFQIVSSALLCHKNEKGQQLISYKWY